MSAVLLADESGRAIGAAAHHSADRYPGAQYLSAVLLDHRMRGTVLGRELLTAVIADARSRSGRPYAMWVVHPENEVMINLSRKVVAGGAEIGHQRASGYLIFVDP